MLLDRNSSSLLLVDVQEKLTPHVLRSQELIERCQWMMRLAIDLEIPLLISEQYPQGLGRTVSSLLSLETNGQVVDKVDFSCYRAAPVKEWLKEKKRKQVVLIGIETHVCVLQTALDLEAAGYEVYVVVDAVSSRSELDYQYALKRMKQQGISLVTSEMVFFEWIGKAGTAEFKAMSKAYLQ